MKHGGNKCVWRHVVVVSDVVMNQRWCGVPDTIIAKHAYLAVASRAIGAVGKIAHVSATVKNHRPRDEFCESVVKRFRGNTGLIRLRTTEPADIENAIALRDR